MTSIKSITPTDPIEDIVCKHMSKEDFKHALICYEVLLYAPSITHCVYKNARIYLNKLALKYKWNCACFVSIIGDIYDKKYN